jgi:hypothetical protein
MQLAIQGQERVEPFPQGIAWCPQCYSEVIAKCGSIMAWHWSHQANDCDSWSEPESQWHISRKNIFPKEWQEVVIGHHRADIKTPTKVVEFQSSSISPEEIRKREDYYGDMIWVLKGEDFTENFDIRDRGNYSSFRWKHPRKSWWHATMPIVIDFDTTFFLVKKLHQNMPCGGWGRYIRHIEFLDLSGLSWGMLSSNPSKFDQAGRFLLDYSVKGIQLWENMVKEDQGRTL